MGRANTISANNNPNIGLFIIARNVGFVYSSNVSFGIPVSFAVAYLRKCLTSIILYYRNKIVNAWMTK